jgi:hypothetical protein
MCECDIKQDQKVFEAASECACEKNLILILFPFPKQSMTIGST